MVSFCRLTLCLAWRRVVRFGCVMASEVGLGKDVNFVGLGKSSGW